MARPAQAKVVGNTGVYVNGFLWAPGSIVTVDLDQLGVASLGPATPGLVATTGIDTGYGPYQGPLVGYVPAAWGVAAR